jgi:hypothetical protein
LERQIPDTPIRPIPSFGRDRVFETPEIAEALAVASYTVTSLGPHIVTEVDSALRMVTDPGPDLRRGQRHRRQKRYGSDERKDTTG